MVTTISGFFQFGYFWPGNFSDNILENQGFVSGPIGGKALELLSSSGTAGLTLQNMGGVAGQDSGYAIFLGHTGTETVTHSIVNSGSVIGAVAAFGTGMSLDNSGAIFGVIQGSDTGSSITNSGMIGYKNLSAQPIHAGLPLNGAIVLGAGDDMVKNTGTIIGNIHLGNGNNTYDGRGGSLGGSVFGGTGNDVYRLTTATAITDTGGIDRIEARFSLTLGSGIENLLLVGFGNFSGTGNELNNDITGNASRNKLLGLVGDDTLSGGGNADSLYGGDGNDVLFGGSGDDRLSGANGTDSAEGGAGNDIIETDAGDDTLLGGADNDSLFGGADNDILLGGSGDDRLSGGGGADSAEGGIGNDVIETGSANDTLQGGDGHDRLDGGTGSDLLEGGVGNDSLIGGAFGTDTMTGGTGADHFIYLTINDSFNSNAADGITDFEVGIDKIDLSALSDSAFQFLGNAPFVATGPGGLPSVRVTQEINGTTVVQVELTGDTFADLRIVLTGTLALTAGDFLL